VDYDGRALSDPDQLGRDIFRISTPAINCKRRAKSAWSQTGMRF